MFDKIKAKLNFQSAAEARIAWEVEQANTPIDLNIQPMTPDMAARLCMQSTDRIIAELEQERRGLRLLD